LLFIVDIVVGRDDDDLKRYGSKGTIPLGKHIVGTGEDVHLTTPLLLDVLRPHLIVLTGKRGTGKSYSLGVIVEEIGKLPDELRKNLCSLIIDPQGIFWTMKTPNEKDTALLNEWGLKSKGFNVSVYVPEGQYDKFIAAGVEADGAFSVHPSQLTAEDWIYVFNLDTTGMISIILRKALKNLHGGHTIDDVIHELGKEERFETEKMSLQNMFHAAKTWGIFGEEKMPDLLVGGKTSVLDVSLTPQNVRALLVSIVSKKIFEERVTARRREETAETEVAPIQRKPMPWIFIDEAHNFLPSETETAATDILNRIVREGRQPGISLIFATQRPEKLHQDALAQADMIISHSLTAKGDVESLKSIMQTYLLYDIGKYINELPKQKGVGIILDDNSERVYKIKIRPRQSWHAGSSPTAL